MILEQREKEREREREKKIIKRGYVQPKASMFLSYVDYKKKIVIWHSLWHNL